MEKLIILNTREVKRLKKEVVEQFGAFFTGEKAYLRNDKGRVFLVNREISDVDCSKLRIEKAGLYIAEMKKGQVRLSKEGAQLLGKEAKKEGIALQQIAELSKGEVKRYFKGEDIVRDLGETNKLVLLQYQNDILGCARYKEGKILNFLPKIHRGEVIL